MNDFDAIFVQVAVEKKMLNPSQAQRAQELIEAAKGAGSTGELLVKNGLLNSMQVKDILRVQMERIKAGGVKPNPMPTPPPKDEGASMTLMVNAADLFGGAAQPAPVQPAPNARPKPQEDPGSQTLALNFNDIMNAENNAAAKAQQPDPGSQTLALNAVDLFGASAQPAAKPPAAPAPRATQPAPTVKPAQPAIAPRPTPPAYSDPSPMQTLALNAADLFGGNVSQAGAKLSSVRNESGQGAAVPPSGSRQPAHTPPTAPVKPAKPTEPVKPAEPDLGGQTLSLDAAGLFGGTVVSSDSSTTPGSINTTRTQPASAGRKPNGSGAANAVPAQPPPKPAAPKADALNAFDIFGLPADAPAAAPIPAPAKPVPTDAMGGTASPKRDEAEGGYTLQLNAADLFGSASEAPKGAQRAPAAGSSTTQPTTAAGSATTSGAPSQPGIEPPMPGREPKPGQTYGNTRIIKRLGEGNMAIVFQGEQGENKQQIAVKFLKPEVGANTTSVKRFVREAESAQKIKHPNVLETYRVCEFRGWHYMEMELMVGEDIRALMKRGTVPLAQALKLCLAAAAGLQAAHEQGVIHRDIKPENLMIMSSGSLKIADFGLARVQEAAGLTMPGQMLGTPAYMAPEQWEGKTPDARTDIYALGVTLYDMITGRRPIEGTTAGAIIQTLFGKGPTPIEQVNPALPKAIVELANQMVKVNPDDRPASMADVRKRMEAALAEIAAGPEPAELKKDATLGATMVTDEAGQAQLQAELKALKNSKDLPPSSGKPGTKQVKPVTKPAEDEATMKMGPGELEKVLAKAPTADEKADAAARDEPTLAMTAEDVESMKRALAETEVKKDAVHHRTDDGGILRYILIGAIVLVVLGILIVAGVVGFFMFFSSALVPAPLNIAPLATLTAALLALL